MKAVGRIGLLVSFAGLLAASLHGCGSSSSSGSGSCDNIAGTWQYKSHCDSGYTGKTTTVSQSGCNFTSSDSVTGSPATGTVSGSSISMSVSTSTCSGSVAGNSISIVCDGTCSITLQRVGGGSSGSGGSSGTGGSSTSTCGEPCPSGCCSPTGRICCKPPFCSGDCAYSSCCM